MIPEASDRNPLDACPDSPNCVRSTSEFHVPIDEVRKAVLEVLESMKAESVEESGDDRIHAVFRIAVFGFRDDVDISLEENEDSGTIVHVRSASRTGYSDLGVNSRRVNRFYRWLTQNLRDE